MLWMERISVIVYVVSLLLLLLITALINSGTADYSTTLNDWIQCFTTALYPTAFFWVLARSFDFVFAGPLRRKIKREANGYQLR